MNLCQSQQQGMRKQERLSCYHKQLKKPNLQSSIWTGRSLGSRGVTAHSLLKYFLFTKSDVLTTSASLFAHYQQGVALPNLRVCKQIGLL